MNRPEMSKQSVIASCLGQMTLSTENAQAAGVMFGLDQAERRPVQTHRGSLLIAVPTEPVTAAVPPESTTTRPACLQTRRSCHDRCH